MNIRSISRNVPQEGNGFVPIFHRDFDSTLKGLSGGALQYFVWMNRHFWRPKSEADRQAHRRWRPDHTAYYREYAAAQLGVSVRTITRRNQELVRAGVIEGRATGRAKHFCRKRESVEKPRKIPQIDSAEGPELATRYKEEKNVLTGFTRDNRSISRCGNVEKERGTPRRGSELLPFAPSSPVEPDPAPETTQDKAPLPMREQLARNREAGLAAFLAAKGIALRPKAGFSHLVERKPQPKPDPGDTT